ncbi:MAG: hypothetical protein OXT06_27005 [Rhodospirillaceae bacterium]|nr:hypothetical protein [Rhodospirillaceae bacterium]MDD9924418.1 hypothetical protein [Rhodospirillaceae bacterium]
MTETPPKKDAKSIFLKSNRSGAGRGLCAAAGIAVVAGLYHAGYIPADSSVMTGVAYAAAGAAGGILVYGIYDIIRKLM